jgi:hypothetical protein
LDSLPGKDAFEVFLANCCEVRHRLDQLEEHYGEILALLSRNSQSGPPTTEIASKPTPRPAACSLTPGREQPCPNTDDQPLWTDALNTRSLTEVEAEALLDDYRQMSEACFPYVLIPKSCTLYSLQMDKPMLWQAILIVSSWRDQAHRAFFQNRFLKRLGEKLLVDGEKSLDILQALLVYCAWYHSYAAQGVRPAYRFASLAVTMALDLGLDRRPNSATQHDMIMNSTSSSAEPHDSSTPKCWSHEARRAFLGAYSLSTLSALLSPESGRLLSDRVTAAKCFTEYQAHLITRNTLKSAPCHCIRTPNSLRILQ